MKWNREGILERCAVSAVTAWGFYLMAQFVNHRWHMATLEQQIKETQAALDHERDKRKADRVGRTRAEQELRAVKVRLQQLQLQLELQQGQEQQQQQRPQGESQTGRGAPASADTQQGQQQQQQQEGQEQEKVESGEEAGVEERDEGAGRREGGREGRREAAARAAAAAAASLAAAGSALSAFPFRPIGHLQSVFTERNGTPRQPQLVPAARSRLVLHPSVPRACLEGLEQYSHCWVLYVFHANTDLAKYLSTDRSGLKAKIHVPRLNGGRMGVLATRSPHRPSPIGLSTAEVIRVEGNSLILGGADIVDGSPVLDIKPYVPFCDSLKNARAPSWVQAEAEDEPLAVGEVVVGEAARAALTRAWTARRTHSMYGSADEFLDLVRQVLSRDIRSVHQRLNVRPTGPKSKTTRGSAPTDGAASDGGGSANGTAHSPYDGVTFALRAVPPTTSPSGQAPVKAVATAAAAGAETGTGSALSGRPFQADGGEGPGHYHVVLENIYISYDITHTGAVQLYDAWVDPITAAVRR